MNRRIESIQAGQSPWKLINHSYATNHAANSTLKHHYFDGSRGREVRINESEINVHRDKLKNDLDTSSLYPN